MRRRASMVAAVGAACALFHCSLLTDLSGLSGGRAAQDGAGATDGPGGESGADGSTPGLGALWLAYGTTAGRVRVRSWREDIGAWSAELPGPDVGGGTVRWVVPKQTPVGSFLAIGSDGVSGRLDVFARAVDGTWHLEFTVPMTRPTRRSFDLEYETLTKSLLVVYGDEAAAPKYRRRSASGWSGEGAAPALGSLRPYWIELARNPLRNEIALMIGDGGSNLGITTWDGNAWSQIRGVEFNLNTEEYKSFDLAYDNATATLLAAWGRLQPVDGGTLADMRYITRTIDGTFSPLKSLNNGAPPGPLVLAPEPGTSRIALSYLEYSCNRGGGTCDDFVAGIWTGTSFTANGALDGDTTTPYGGRVSTMVTGVAWLGTTGVAIAAYHRDLPNPGQLPFVRFAGNAWGTVSGADANPPLPPRASMQLVTAPGPSVVALVEDTNGSLWAKGYRETSGAGAWADVGGGAPLATGLVIAGGVPFGATTP